MTMHRSVLIAAIAVCVMAIAVEAQEYPGKGNTGFLGGISGDNLHITALPPVQPEDSIFTFTRSDEDFTPHLVFTIKANGEVGLGEGVTMSDAAKAFWTQVGQGAPCAIKQIDHVMPSPRNEDCVSNGMGANGLPTYNCNLAEPK